MPFGLTPKDIADIRYGVMTGTGARHSKGLFRLIMFPSIALGVAIVGGVIWLAVKTHDWITSGGFDGISRHLLEIAVVAALIVVVAFAFRPRRTRVRTTRRGRR